MLCSLLIACTEDDTIDGKSKDAVYDEAVEHLERGELHEAYTKFKELGDYLDSEDFLASFHYVPKSTSLYLDGSDEPLFSSTVLYNANHLPMKATVSDGSRESSYEYKYNSDGALTEKVARVLGQTYVTTYNCSGIIRLSETQLFPDGSTLEAEYTYNNDYLVENIVYTTTNIREPEDGSTETPEPDVSTYTVTFEYDSKGRLIKETSGEGEYATLAEYTYDGKGNVTKYTYSSADKKNVYYSIATTYDSNDQPTKKVITESGEQIVYTFTYNSDLTEVNVAGSLSDGSKISGKVEYDLVYINLGVTNAHIKDILQDVTFIME